MGSHQKYHTYMCIYLKISVLSHSQTRAADCSTSPYIRVCVRVSFGSGWLKCLLTKVWSVTSQLLPAAFLPVHQTRIRKKKWKPFPFLHSSPHFKHIYPQFWTQLTWGRYYIYVQEGTASENDIPQRTTKKKKEQTGWDKGSNFTPLRS
jgi:hypothetical protein